MRRFGPPAHPHASSIPGALTVNVQQLFMLRVHHPFILCLGIVPLLNPHSPHATIKAMHSRHSYDILVCALPSILDNHSWTTPSPHILLEPSSHPAQTATLTLTCLVQRCGPPKFPCEQPTQRAWPPVMRHVRLLRALFRIAMEWASCC